MRFIPDYRVFYKGVFYECGEEFEIDPADEEEMSEHGEVLGEPTPPKEEEPVEDKPNRGRRRKNDEPGEDEAPDERA